MTIESLLSTLEKGFNHMVDAVKGEADLSEIEKYKKQYDPKGHDVLNPGKRKNKKIKDDDGKDTEQPVARIALALQKLIVRRAAAFLCGNPIKISATVEEKSLEEKLLFAVEKIWEYNKLDYKSKSIAKRMMAFTGAAELWYWEDADTEEWSELELKGVRKKLRMTIISVKDGDDLYPVFSDTGDMIAFGRGYRIVDENGEEVEHFDIYTASKIFYGIDNKGAWEVNEEINPFEKIPVIYYSQEEPEWADVQTMIDRLETIISNHADTNDYFGDPMVVVDGEVKGFAKKGETGKMIEVGNGAKVHLLTWDSAPESVKQEIDNLLRFIYTFTDTPDISFEQMKSIGGNAPSGFALKMLFLGAHLKASDKEEIFGECIQRRLNFLKDAVIKIAPKLAGGKNLYMKPQFEYYLPKNDAEKVDMLNNAVQGGILSIDSAVYANPIVVDPDAEIEKLQAGKVDREMNE